MTFLTFHYVQLQRSYPGKNLNLITESCIYHIITLLYPVKLYVILIMHGHTVYSICLGLLRIQYNDNFDELLPADLNGLDCRDDDSKSKGSRDRDTSETRYS